MENYETEKRDLEKDSRVHMKTFEKPYSEKAVFWAAENNFGQLKIILDS